MVEGYFIGSSSLPYEEIVLMLYLQMIESDDDKEKFEEIYTRYRRLMYFVAFKVVQNDKRRI